MHKEIVKSLLVAPESQMDPIVKPMIEKWADPPTPIQILEVLDYCIYSSLTSTFVTKILQILYDNVCKDNNTTHEEVVKGAIWRK